MGVMDRASLLVIGTLERFFYWWGKFVTRRPYPVILTCLLLTALSSLGFLNFRWEASTAGQCSGFCCHGQQSE